MLRKCQKLEAARAEERRKETENIAQRKQAEETEKARREEAKKQKIIEDGLRKQKEANEAAKKRLWQQKKQEQEMKEKETLFEQATYGGGVPTRTGCILVEECEPTIELVVFFFYNI